MKKSAEKYDFLKKYHFPLNNACIVSIKAYNIGRKEVQKMNINKKSNRELVAEMVANAQANGYIYFATTGRYIKAGYTKNPKRRVSDYITDNPMFKIYGLLPVNEKRAERWCQRMLLELGCKRMVNEPLTVEWYVMPDGWNKDIVKSVVQKIMFAYAIEH